MRCICRAGGTPAFFSAATRRKNRRRDADATKKTRDVMSTSPASKTAIRNARAMIVFES